jgi:hypothetical protein
VCVCVCACVRACVFVCVREFVCVCVYACMQRYAEEVGVSDEGHTRRALLPSSMQL